jgi:tetratricopeptide (TPR) repeat protein
MGDLAEAAVDARAAIELGDAPARFVSVAGKGSFQARSLLAGILRASGDVAGAREQLELAVTEAPHFATAVEELTELLLDGGDEPADVSATIDELLGERALAPTPNLRVGAVLHEAGHFDEAELRYARVLEAAPSHAGALVARSELRLAQGRLRDAWDDAMSIDELHPIAARGACAAFLAAAALGDVELLAAPAARIMSSEVLPAAERSIYAAWRGMLDPAHAGITSLVPQDGVAVEALLRNLQALIRLEATDAFERLHPLAQQVMPDERQRRMAFAELYLRACFADMAGEELMACAERFGPEAAILTGLGKDATMKGMWEDAEIFLSESLAMDPSQPDARRLLSAVQERIAG